MRFLLAQWHRLPLVFHQAIVYASVGFASLVADFAFYALLTRELRVYYILANVISFAVIGTLNFFANRRFTFAYRGTPEIHQYTKFFLIAGVGITLNTLLLAIFVSIAHLHDLLAKFLAAVVVFFWNFGMNRYWTFRHPGGPQVPVTPL